LNIAVTADLLLAAPEPPTGHSVAFYGREIRLRAPNAAKWSEWCCMDLEPSHSTQKQWEESGHGVTSADFHPAQDVQAYSAGAATS
jgi:hypothetical protein